MDFSVTRANLYSYCGVYGPGLANINVSNGSNPDYRELSIILDPWENVCHILEYHTTYFLKIENEPDNKYRVWMWQ